MSTQNLRWQLKISTEQFDILIVTVKKTFTYNDSLSKVIDLVLDSVCDFKKLGYYILQFLIVILKQTFKV